MKLRILAAIPFVLMTAFASTSALANDQITSDVSNPVSIFQSSTSGPMEKGNGVPPGTLQLWYTYSGNNYPCSSSGGLVEFATFDLALSDQAGKGSKTPDYSSGIQLNLNPTGGGTPVQLQPATDSFTVAGLGSVGGTTVTVYINCDNLPSGAPYDGEDIVGNLTESTSPSGSYLDTITGIQVHIILSIPSSACLKLYSFEENSGTLYSTPGPGVGITEHTNTHTGITSVTASQPGTMDADGLVVNFCSTPQPFDLSVALDTDWDTQPANNNGIALNAYTITGQLSDPAVSTISIPTSGGTGYKDTLCVQDETLGVGDSFLVTVRSALKSITPAALPSSGVFTFQAELWAQSSNCTTAPVPPPTGDVGPISPSNPASSSMSFSITNN